MESTRIAAWLALCFFFVVLQASGQEPSDKPKPKVEFRWLESQPIPGVTEEKGIRTSCGDELSYLHKQPILTNMDVAEVRLSKIDVRQDGILQEQFMIHFHLTAEGRQILAATCGKSGDKLLAVVIDGTYRGAPYFLKSRDASNFVPFAGYFSSKPMVERIVAAFGGVAPGNQPVGK